MEATEVAKLARLEDTHWWYRERRYLLRQMVAAAFPEGPAGRLALDIGAAGGGNTRVLRALGMTAVPLEHDLGGAGVAKQRGLPAVVADARRLPIPAGALDLVVAFDVLEHIEEDKHAVAEIHRVLRPGGALLIAVPADMSLWSDHDRAVGHVRRYSRTALEGLVEGAGLRIAEVRSWNVLLRPVVRIRRSSRRGSDLDDVHPALNWGLRFVIAAERPLVRFGLGRRAGVSLLLRAVKPSS